MSELVGSFEAVRYIFEKTMVEPTTETNMMTSQRLELTEMEVVSEPISTLGYKESAEEIKDIEACNKMLREFQKSTPHSSSKTGKLILMLQKAGNSTAAKETAKLTLKLFPSYLFGKIVYANLLIDEGKLDQVPQLFNGEYNLKSVYPERTQFHVQEFLAFNILWCNYFIEKDDLYPANLHYMLNTKIDVPEEYMIDTEILFKLNIKICNYVKELIVGDKAKFTKKELIKTLIN